MRSSIIWRVARAKSAKKRPPREKSFSRRCASWFLGNSSDLRQKERGGRKCQSRNVVCDGDDEVARLDISRVRTRVFQRQRWRTLNGGKGGPLQTREGRGAQGNGPRRRGSRLGVLSAKPSGSPIDPRHPEISGGLRRLQRRVHRHLGTFWAVLGG